MGVCERHWPFLDKKTADFVVVAQIVREMLAGDQRHGNNWFPTCRGSTHTPLRGNDNMDTIDGVLAIVSGTF